MRKWLIGPALACAGCAAGGYYGARAEQVVHKSPDATYEGVSHALDNINQSGMTSFQGGKPVPYELKVEREPDSQIIVHLMLDGQEGARTEIDFTPADDGKATMVTAKAHGERAVLTPALAGTSMARLAYAPDWMLNLLTVRPLLQQLAKQIEKGEPPQIAGMSEADWESQLPPDQQRQVQEWRQYDATRPMTDPDAVAQNYMSGGSGQ